MKILLLLKIAKLLIVFHKTHVNLEKFVRRLTNSVREVKKKKNLHKILKTEKTIQGLLYYKIMQCFCSNFSFRIIDMWHLL